MSSAPRNRRYLAAWGYQSDTTGTKIEVDVWSVNAPVEEETALDRAREALAGDDRVDVIDAAASVAKVRYRGIDSVGYLYYETGEKATQQAYAGGRRSEGGGRTGAGTFGEGWKEPEDAPTLDECIAFGEAEVIPALREDLRRAGSRELAQAVEKIEREPSRDEDGEETTDRETDGFRNAARIFPRNGSPYEYEVDTRRDRLV
jgi:hypothetical protein